MVSVELQAAFGCVVFDVVLMWVLLFWMMAKVGAARKKYGVKVQTFFLSFSYKYCKLIMY